MADEQPDTIHLYDPDYISLSFGPNNEIQFGPKGGFEEHHWIGLRTERLLPQLLTTYPRIREADAPMTAVYVCEIDGAEFGTKVGLRNHKRSHTAGE